MTSPVVLDPLTFHITGHGLRRSHDLSSPIAGHVGDPVEEEAEMEPHKTPISGPCTTTP